MIEYLILAPLDLEIQSLLRAFDALGTPRHSLRDGSSYFKVRCRTRSGDRADLRIVQLKHAGVLQAAVTTSRLIEEWHPACVVSFGIAGGFLEGGDIGFEDVVVAEHVFYYEPAKEAVTKVKRLRKSPALREAARLASVERENNHIRRARLVPFQCDPAVVAKCRNLWSERPERPGWKVHFGPIASGEKLLADIESPTRKAILDLNDKMLAVEMEAAGVGAATMELDRKGGPHRFVAIKGISDSASTKKGSQKKHRKPAADHAADFCRQMVESLPVEDDFQRLEEIDIHLIHARATEICNYVNPLLEAGNSLSEDQISALLAEGSTVPVFYHWTAEQRLHWVDFRFLLVLRRLKELGLVPRLLISDIRDDFTRASRTPIEKLARAVLGDDTPIYWYQDTLRHQERYFRYAASRGLSQDVLERMFSDTEEILLKAFWIKFIGWEVRWGNRCMLLQWHKQADAAKRMSRMVVLRSAVLPTPDINLGGGLGKKAAPGANLFIEPPDYKSILDWIESDPDPELVQQFVDQFAVERQPDGAELDAASLLSGRASLAARMRLPEAAPKATQLLIQKLVGWNQRLFNEARPV
jgi:nucleoside phosphorylase